MIRVIVAVIVLGSAGDKAFCSGVDLSSISNVKVGR